MNRLIIIQSTLVGALTGIAWFFWGWESALSVGSGGLLTLTGVVLWAFTVKLIFRKKLIALSVGIIVFKYAILGIIVYCLVRSQWFHPLHFAMGVASFAISGLIYSSFTNKNEQE